MIGNEDDPSRYNTKANSAILILAGLSSDQIEAKYNCINKYAKAGLNKFRENKVLVITSEQSPDLSADFVICGSISSSPLDIWMHLAIKLFLNTASTLTMASMGRVLGNWMICAEATNKKLIDRGTRLVSEIAGLDYETACIEFHKSMDIINSNQNPRDEYIPPSAFTIYRLRTAFDENSGRLPNCNEILKQLNRG